MMLDLMFGESKRDRKRNHQANRVKREEEEKKPNQWKRASEGVTSMWHTYIFMLLYHAIHWNGMCMAWPRLSLLYAVATVTWWWQKRGFRSISIKSEYRKLWINGHINSDRTIEAKHFRDRERTAKKIKIAMLQIMLCPWRQYFFGEKNEEHLMRIIFHYEYVEDIVNWPVNPCPMMWTNSQTMADASTPFAASLTLFCCCCCLLSHSTYTSISDRKSTQNCVLIALCSSSTICKQNARMYVIFAQLYTVLLLSVFVFYRHIQNECAQAAACRGC